MDITTILGFLGGFAGLVTACLSIYFAKSDKTKKDISNLREIIDVLRGEREEDKKEIEEMKREIKKNSLYAQAANLAYKCKKVAENPEAECLVLKHIIESQKLS